MFNVWRKVGKRQPRVFGVFYVLLTIIACIVIGGSSNVNAESKYRFDIYIHADYSITNCRVSGDDVVCNFNVTPDKDLSRQEGFGNPPSQKLYIDIEPTNNSYMKKVNEAYLGYWQPWNEKLQDRQTPSYTIRAKKGNLNKKEIKGDITTVEYTTELCFRVDLHWNDIGNGYVTHGISDFCRDIKASETVSSKFKGKTKSGSVSTGWVNDSKTEIRYIHDCSITEGCEAEFVHSLKRTAGYGSADYEVSRTSNYWRPGGIGVEPKTLKASEESFGSDDSKTVYKETVKLVPGQVVCESMYFRTNSENSHKTTGVCVIALGDVNAAIDEKVKNNEMSGNFQKKAYAKPDDNLTYRTTYDPTLQYAYYLKPQYMKIDDGKIFIPEYHSAMLGYAFNIHKSSDDRNWNNSFSVMGTNFWLSKNYSWDAGDDTERIVDNDYKVYSSEVGKVLMVTARTNTNDTVKTTPGNIAFSEYSNSALTRVGTGDIRSSAEVWVPYNFYNETRVTDVNDVIYAGEEASIDYEIVTGLKENSKLNNARYATVAKKAKWKVEVCYGEGYEKCFWSEEKNGNLHESEGMYDEAIKNDSSTKTTVSIPDLTAGTKVRVRSAVYPKDSGADDNIKVDYYDSSDPNTWAYSEPVELVVAKRPSFQVWGGSVYSAGKVDIPIANKIEYGRRFGSWAEFSVIANGGVTGLASGAGLGYATYIGDTMWPKYKFDEDDHWGNNAPWLTSEQNSGGIGGNDIDSDNYCKISFLSFANMYCNSSNGGNSNYVGGLNMGAPSDRFELISRFDGGDTGSVVGEISLSGESGAKIEEGIYYYRGKNSLIITESEIDMGKTKVVNSDNDVRIAGNIKYQNDGYGRMEDVPKVIVYTKGNIVIDCQVQQIDAVLIAEKNISTCNSGDQNAWQNSTQLNINGAVIADNFTLERTYGAATMYNSMVPAEIINYDASLYLWVNGKSDVTKTGNIVTTYQTELSPRY